MQPACHLFGYLLGLRWDKPNRKENYHLPRRLMLVLQGLWKLQKARTLNYTNSPPPTPPPLGDQITRVASTSTDPSGTHRERLRCRTSASDPCSMAGSRAIGSQIQQVGSQVRSNTGPLVSTRTCSPAEYPQSQLPTFFGIGNRAPSLCYEVLPPLLCLMLWLLSHSLPCNPYLSRWTLQTVKGWG